MKSERVEHWAIIKKILKDDWNPVGLHTGKKEADDYEGYIPGVYALLNQGRTPEELCEHLMNEETRYMGITPAEGEGKRVLAVAEKLIIASKPFVPNSTL